MKLLAFDTETGGLDPKDASLLTAYFAVLNSKFEIVDSLYLKVKPNDDLFKANPQALQVNKINLDLHKSEAIPYTDAAIELSKFLAKHSNSRDKLTPVAHNIEFDLGFINEHLLDKRAWETYVSYRKLDTAQISNFLKLTGTLPVNQKNALGDLAKSMGIKFDGAAHSADADTKVMIEVLKGFVERVKCL